MNDSTPLAVSYGTIKVNYLPRLDGGGTTFGQDYVPVIRERFGKVGRVCEFASGPGFIGFSLLAHGLCDSLCLVDVNPDAVEMCRKTIRENGLEDKVSVYHSDALAGVPAHEKWDLVVSNPPHFDGSEVDYKSNIRLIDPGWRIHKKLYADIGPHLTPTGTILMQENGDGSSAKTWDPILKGTGLRVVDSFDYKPLSLFLHHRREYDQKYRKSFIHRLLKTINTPRAFLKWKKLNPYYFVLIRKE